jgi:hypothetical protein
MALQPGVFQTNQINLSYLDLPPEGVLVQVGARRVTRAVFDELVEEWLRLNQQNRRSKKNADESRMRWQAVSYIFNNLMARAALLQEADARGITPGTNHLASAERHMQVMAEKMGGRDVWAKKANGGEAAIAKRMREEAVIKALVDAEFGNTLIVKESEANALREELLAKGAASDATNKFFYTTMTNLRERIVSGKLGSVTSEWKTVRALLPDGVSSSGAETQKAIHLGEEKVVLLTGLTLGECSAVFEEDTYFKFLMLCDKTIDQETPILSSFTFIEFRAPLDPGWDIPSLKVLRLNLANERLAEKMEPWVRDLIRKAGVVYPNGVHLFDKLNPDLQRQPRKQRAQPPPGPRRGLRP